MLRRQRGGITWEAMLQEGGVCGPGAGLALPLIACCVILVNLVPSWGHGLISEASGRFTFSVHEVAPSQTSPVMTRGLCPWVGRSILGEDSQAHEKERSSRGSWPERGLILPDPSQRRALFSLIRLSQRRERRKRKELLGLPWVSPNQAFSQSILSSF